MGIGPQRLGTAKGFTPCGSPIKQRRKKKKQQSEYENKTKFFPQYNVSTDTIISGSHPDESEARLIMMENVRGAGLDIPSYENIVQTTDGKNKNFHALVKKLKL